MALEAAAHRAVCCRRPVRHTLRPALRPLIPAPLSPPACACPGAEQDALYARIMGSKYGGEDAPMDVRWVLAGQGRGPAPREHAPRMHALHGHGAAYPNRRLLRLAPLDPPPQLPLPGGPVQPVGVGGAVPPPHAQRPGNAAGAGAGGGRGATSKCCTPCCAAALLRACAPGCHDACAAWRCMCCVTLHVHLMHACCEPAAARAAPAAPVLLP